MLQVFPDATPIEKPVKEIGSLYAYGVPGFGGASLIDFDEYNTDLVWPNSVFIYPEMLNDTQVDSLWTGLSYPIRQWKWFLRQCDADPAMTQKLADDLGLAVQVEEGDDTTPPRQRRRGFSHKAHLADALRSLYYGHYFFEQWGEIVDGVWRLTNVAPRPPKTINQIKVDRAGELISIQQNLSMFEPPLPASVLASYVWDREGANWFGHSILRSIYAPWRLKQRLLNVDRIKHERNALGVAVAKAMQGASSGDLEKAQQMASAVRAGDEGGVALPYGYDLSLEGVRGSTSTPLDSVKYYDEVMARRLFQMLSMLGTTATGNRAIGAEFRDLLDLGLSMIGGWYAETFTQEVIEKWWTWNVGEDAPAPELAFDSSSVLTMDVLATLVQAGALKVDDGLEEYIRTSHNLPPRQVTRAQQTIDETPPPPPPTVQNVLPPGPAGSDRMVGQDAVVKASAGVQLLDANGAPVTSVDGSRVMIGSDGRAFLAPAE